MHDCKREQEEDNREIKTTEKRARDGQKEKVREKCSSRVKQR